MSGTIAGQDRRTRRVRPGRKVELDAEQLAEPGRQRLNRTWYRADVADRRREDGSDLGLYRAALLGAARMRSSSDLVIQVANAHAAIAHPLVLVRARSRPPEGSSSATQPRVGSGVGVASVARQVGPDNKVRLPIDHLRQSVDARSRCPTGRSRPPVKFCAQTKHSTGINIPGPDQRSGVDLHALSQCADAHYRLPQERHVCYQ